MEQWEKDLEAESAKKKRREAQGPHPIDPEAEAGKRTTEVVDLLSKGQIHRAVDRINSHRVADMRDPSVMNQMTQKHP